MPVTIIPLLMSLELLKHHDDDRMQHQLRVGVVGVERPITADIESDFYKNPRVTDSWGAALDVSASLEDAFVVACFDMLHPTMDGPAIGEIYLPDATDWIERVFPAADAQVLLAALSRQVTPGLVQPGDRYTSMIPYHPPVKGAQP